MIDPDPNAPRNVRFRQLREHAICLIRAGATPEDAANGLLAAAAWLISVADEPGRTAMVRDVVANFPTSVQRYADGAVQASIPTTETVQ